MKKVRLEDVCYSASSNISQKDVMMLNGQYSVYGASGLIKKINFYKYDREYIAIIKDGAGIGRVRILPANSSVISTMQYIFPKENINIRFLYYALKSMNLAKYYSGVTIPHIYYKDYKKEKLYLPNMNEQIYIVKKLDNIQDSIDLRKKQIEELGKLVKSQFVEMFGDVNDNKNNYEIKSLNEIFEFIKDGTHSTPTYTEDNINGVKFLSAKDVTTGTINWENIKYIPLELHNQLVKRVKPQKDDILLAKNGTTGICAKVDTDEVFDIYVSLALLRPKKEYLVDYLVQAINNDMTKEQFDRSLKGVGVPNLHLGEIQKVKIIVPPIELQNKFAEFVKQINKQKIEMQNSLKEMQKLQESLMKQYFGE